MRKYENLSVELAGSTATVSISRPEARNALDSKTVTELTDLALDLDRSSPIRTVILTGGDTRSFVSGGDIREMAPMDTIAAQAYLDKGASLMKAIEGSSKPWIAAVNGYCFGGGVEVALACDFIYASSRATFGMPEGRLGIIPGFGGTQRLMRKIGIGHASELIYGGKSISAEEAHKIGLVNAVFGPSELLPATHEIASRIADNSPAAVAEAKRVLHEGRSKQLSLALDYERNACASLFATPEQREGMQAFLEKRDPRFTK